MTKQQRTTHIRECERIIDRLCDADLYTRAVTDINRDRTPLETIVDFAEIVLGQKAQVKR